MPCSEGELPRIADKLNWLGQSGVLSGSQNSRPHNNTFPFNLILSSGKPAQSKIF